jgi:tryptophan synthase alpha chain
LSVPSPIAAVFAELKAQRRQAFIPFVTAGDPDLAWTARLLTELAACGADVIEVGFPYSDPIADGPVIQASYTRALNKHVRVRDIFAEIAKVSPDLSPPLVAMVSYALIFRGGAEAFLDSAAAAGFAGLIVPDLPGDEAQPFAALVRRHGLDLIQLVAPTTPADRMQRIVQNASGFVYCIAVAGTTGVREALPAELADMLKTLRQQTDLPLCVGFGISRPEQVRQLKGLADGVIVGSAIVRHLEALSAGPTEAESMLQQIREFARSLANAAHADS